MIKHLLDVAPGVKAFMDMLVLGGIASMIVGVLTRSYLALPLEKLPEFLQYDPLLDPLPDLMVFLGLCIVLGVIHLKSSPQRWPRALVLSPASGLSSEDSGLVLPPQASATMRKEIPTRFMMPLILQEGCHFKYLELLAAYGEGAGDRCALRAGQRAPLVVRPCSEAVVVCITMEACSM